MLDRYIQPSEGAPLINRLSDEELLFYFNKIASTARFEKKDDRTWLADPSIKRFVKNFGRSDMIKLRKDGYTKEIVHSIEVASLAVTYRHCIKPRKGYTGPKPSQKVIAFVGMAHDKIENDRRLTAKKIVDTCCYDWDKRDQGLSIRAINGLTDALYLVEMEDEARAHAHESAKAKAAFFIAEARRLREQKYKANGDDSGLASLVRASDKGALLNGDLFTLLAGGMPHGSINRFCESHGIRSKYFNDLRIGQELKGLYNRKIDDIEEANAIKKSRLLLNSSQFSEPLRNMKSFPLNGKDFIRGQKMGHGFAIA